MRARERQLTRFRAGEKIYCNAQMGSRHIRKFCDLSADCERLLERAMRQQGLSARAHDRILKVVADDRRPGRRAGQIEPSTSPRRFSTAAWTGHIGREEIQSTF